MPNPFENRHSYIDTPSWKLYTNNPDTWQAMLALIRNARHTIDIEQFIFVDDEIGSEFIKALTEKAKAGIRVRVLLDAAGSFTLFGSAFVAELSENNIQVGFFNRFIPQAFAFHSQKLWFFRNHRRSLIVDAGTEHSTAITGSHCVWEKARSWRDTSMLVTGEPAQEVSRAFSIMWNRANSVKTDWGFDKPTATEGINYVYQSPFRSKKFIYNRLIEAIRGAHSYVYITVPYFVPDHRLVRVIRLAAKRGVDVRIILPKKSDHPVVDLAGQAYFHKLLKYGVSIYHYLPHIIHAKTCIIDDEWATVGSLNMDHVSLHYNFEGNMVITDTDCISELKKHFHADLTRSTLITLVEWNHRSLHDKLLQMATIPLRKVL